MSQLGKCVKIIASPELSEMKMEAFVGFMGMIEEDLAGKERKEKGYIVSLSGIQPVDEDECGLWFIPQNSVEILKAK